jgi:hypothetical protein
LKVPPLSPPPPIFPESLLHPSPLPPDPCRMENARPNARRPPAQALAGNTHGMRRTSARNVHIARSTILDLRRGCKIS